MISRHTSQPCSSSSDMHCLHAALSTTAASQPASQHARAFTLLSGPNHPVSPIHAASPPLPLRPGPPPPPSTDPACLLPPPPSAPASPLAALQGDEHDQGPGLHWHLRLHHPHLRLHLRPRRAAVRARRVGRHQAAGGGEGRHAVLRRAAQVGGRVGGLLGAGAWEVGWCWQGKLPAD